MRKNGFASGLIAGGFVGAVALTWALSDRRVRRRMRRETQKIIGKVNNLDLPL